MTVDVVGDAVGACASAAAGLKTDASTRTLNAVLFIISLPMKSAWLIFSSRRAERLLQVGRPGQIRQDRLVK
jgi:hypothetical protein